MARLRLQLFGGFHATHDDGLAIPLTARKGEALIAYLALSPNQRQSRERLAALLWGDRFEEQARHSLRQTVLALRKALGDTDSPIVISEGEFLLLNGAAIEVDALAFRDLVRDGSTAALSRAIALYVGDLLEGITIRAAEFDDWLLSERVRYRDMAIDAHTALMGQQSDQGDAEAALATGQRLLVIDPANEDAHRSIMQLYDRSGRRSAALRQFKLYADTLRNEFDAEPDPQIVQLQAEIQARDRQHETHHESDLPNDLKAKSTDRVGPSETLFAPPEKPSIIVVPFKDPADGNSLKGLAFAITEGIATALSMVPVLTVSAPGSTPPFMGQDIQGDVPLRESDNQFVLEGSVQSFSDNVRISARLTDLRSGHLVWGDRYDRVIDDMFALQDEITLNIVASLEVKLTESEHEQFTLSPGTRNLQAWLLVGQGVQLLQSLTREDIAKSRECFEQATLLDPDYASGWAGLAWTHFVEAWSRWSATPLETLERAAKLTEKALELDPSRPRTYSLLGIIRLMAGNHRDAVAMGEKALKLNPNGAEAAAFLALTLTYSGDHERSIALAGHAINLSPYDGPWYDWILGRAYRLAGRYEDAIAILSRKLEHNTGPIWPHIELACSCAEMGLTEETKTVVTRIITIDPGFSVAEWTAAPSYADPIMSKREVEVLRKAGLPE